MLKRNCGSDGDVPGSLQSRQQAVVSGPTGMMLATSGNAAVYSC
jgi:hypothetical protein